MESSPTTIKQKIPITTHSRHSHTPDVRKYALKYLNRLNIYDKTKWSLRIKYIKKVLFLECPISCLQHQNQWRQIVPKVVKRFRKLCKGIDELDQKFLSMLYSSGKCPLSNIFDLPLQFKLGRFTKLALKLQAIPLAQRKSSQMNQQIYKIITNIKRSKSLRTLNIKFVENALDMSCLFLQELQKHPDLISSLQSFGFDYKNHFIHSPSFSESLTNLPNITQSVTHLYLNITDFWMFDVDFQHFTKLRCLNLALMFADENDFLIFNSFEALKYLETFILEIPLRTQEAVEGLVQNFQLPKSIKKISLTRSGHSIENFSLAEVFGNKTSCLNFWEEWSPLKRLYQRWEGFDQLSDLTLIFESTPDYSDIDFFFMAPILKRCRSLKRLSIKTTCFECATEIEHSRHLQWTDILQALESSKHSLEYLEIEVCKIDFEENVRPDFTLKNLKDLNITIRMIETGEVPHVSGIAPKTIMRFQSFYG